MRGKLKNAGIRKKLVCYSYAIITPILMLISICLFVRNYHRTMAEERELCQKDVENLSGNLDTLLDGMVEFGTYICINNDILAILSSDDAQALNRDSQLWVHEAPMRTLQDMIALSGQIKTLAIYPENGVNPYLRCADAAAYISSIEEIRQTACYRNAVEKRGKYSFVWVRAIFTRRTAMDKIVQTVRSMTPCQAGAPRLSCDRRFDGKIHTALRKIVVRGYGGNCRDERKRGGTDKNRRAAGGGVCVRVREGTGRRRQGL